jgi:hypothetical protein
MDERSRRRGWEQEGKYWRATDVSRRRWRRLLALLDCDGLMPSLEDYRFRDERALSSPARVFNAETWLVEFATWAEDGFPADERADDLLGEWAFTEVLLSLTMDDEEEGLGCSVPGRLRTAVIERVADGEHPWVPVIETTWWGYCDALYAYLTEGPRVPLDDPD